MKKLLAVIIIFAMSLSLCGCKKTKVTMKVQEYRSGFGIAGQDFTGYKEYEIKNIKEGDAIRGNSLAGELTVVKGDEAKGAWLIKIDSISEEEVVLTTPGGTVRRSYGIPLTIEPLSHMDDGPNYSYIVVFN